MINIMVDSGRCEMNVSGGSRVIARDFLSAIITIHNRLKVYNPEQAETFKRTILLGINHKENWTKEPGKGAELTATYIPRPQK